MFLRIKINNPIFNRSTICTTVNESAGRTFSVTEVVASSACWYGPLERTNKKMTSDYERDEPWYVKAAFGVFCVY